MSDHIVIVDDEAGLREIMKMTLVQHGFHVWTFGTAKAALDFLQHNLVDAFIIDIRLPDLNGIDLIRRIREHDPYVPVIVITAYASMETALEALRLHAVDYLVKPFDLQHLVHRTRRALHEYRLWKENVYLRQRLRDFEMPQELVFESPQMRALLQIVERIAPTPLAVLITGESGVGKEVIAQLIHEWSQRPGPFVSINCAAVPPTLLETELFGHVKGAFTGAIAHKKGLFEIAHRGTLFLDEIAELPLEMQPKLLRVLEEQKVRPIGATHAIDVDVRVIAATNRDLTERVAQGLFREDLFYRLNVFHIPIPPLRERPEDILPLAEMFLRKYRRQIPNHVRAIAPETRELLRRYTWPGNVRQLENTILRALLVEMHEELHPHALPPEVLNGVEPAHCASIIAEVKFPIDLDRYIEEVRKGLIVRALRTTGGSRKKAAELLQLPLRSLKYYMQKYGLSARQFRMQQSGETVERDAKRRAEH